MDQTPTKRRWQFSLGVLIYYVMVAALALGLLANIVSFPRR